MHVPFAFAWSSCSCGFSDAGGERMHVFSERNSEGANVLRTYTRTSPARLGPGALPRLDAGTVSACVCVPSKSKSSRTHAPFAAAFLLGHATRAGRCSLLSGCVMLAASVRGTSAFNVVLRACVCPGSHSHRSAAHALSRISRSPCMHARVCVASPAHALVPHLAAWGSICTTRVPPIDCQLRVPRTTARLCSPSPSPLLCADVC